MWVKRNGKTIFLDLSEYFLNFGFIEDDYLMKIVSEAKYNEVVKLILPKKMISDIQEAFTTLDCQVEGSVNERDIKVTLRALGIEPTSTKNKTLMERVNSGGTSKVKDELSRENYEKLMVEVIHDIDSDEQMIKSFAMFDYDKLGVITFETLKDVSKQLEFTATDEEMQEMISIADSDKDGKVTQDEFVEIARKIF